MNDTVRIRLSAGLFLLAGFHAVMVALLVFAAVRPNDPKPREPRPWRVPDRAPGYYPDRGRIEKLTEPPVVNLEAQGELKQQNCSTCVPQSYPQRYPQRYPQGIPGQQIINGQLYINGERVVAIGPSRVVPTRRPAANPQPTLSPGNGVYVPTASESATVNVGLRNSGSTNSPPAKHYQIALFVGSDQQSRSLVEWFRTDPQLSKLQQHCSLQIYTAGHAMYKARFADLVPVEQFPVMLFQDATGGHIHAAGRNMIPGSAAQLYDDMHKGHMLYRQAREATKTGALKTRGYSWDAAIDPSMQLTSQDCPDGYCPDEPPAVDSDWRPGDRIRDTLFDQAKDTRNLFVWANLQEIIGIAMIAIVGILLVVTLIKRGI